MVGLPPSGYRITAHDGHLASCDGNKQALAPVGVPPRRFSAVSYLGAFCCNPVVSSNRRPENTLKVPSGSPAQGGVVLHVRQSDGDTRAPGGRLHSCGGPDHVWVGCEASQPLLRRFSRRFSGVFTGFLTLHASEWSVIHPVTQKSFSSPRGPQSPVARHRHRPWV